jgi:uncharacterized protein with gpF-like domain
MSLRALAPELFADRDVAAGPVPAEVIAYWKKKKLAVGFSYLDVWNEEHDHSFTAAKIMREDVLLAMQEELDRAFTNGLPFEEFAKSAEERFKALGWWDEHEVQDPQTGRVVTISPPHRLWRIYETNMRTARAVGQLDRIERQKKAFPYLLYQVGPSEKHREVHLGWHGVLLPVDDPFWNYAFPPNGWGCKCHVRSVTKLEYKKLEDKGVMAPEREPVLDDDGKPTGHKVDKRIPVQTKAPKLDFRPFKNPRTGKTDFVPDGIDPGFHHRPGEGRELALQPKPKK